MDNLVKVIPVVQAFAYPKDVGKLLGYKTTKTYEFLKNFREFVEERPNFFHPHVPLIDEGKNIIRYNVLCIHYFNERYEELKAGGRNYSFQKELPRLKEAWM